MEKLDTKSKVSNAYLDFILYKKYGISYHDIKNRSLSTLDNTALFLNDILYGLGITIFYLVRHPVLRTRRDNGLVKRNRVYSYRFKALKISLRRKLKEALSFPFK